jgi:hypothetical protein
MSFPALAIAAAAATEVCRYSGTHPSFLSSLDIRPSHFGDHGELVFDVTATAHLFGYVHITKDGPLGVCSLVEREMAG